MLLLSCEDLSACTVHDRLTLHFEEKLQLTWDNWLGVIDQVSTISHAGLRPNLVPPREFFDHIVSH